MMPLLLVPRRAVQGGVTRLACMCSACLCGSQAARVMHVRAACGSGCVYGWSPDWRVVE